MKSQEFVQKYSENQAIILYTGGVVVELFFSLHDILPSNEHYKLCINHLFYDPFYLIPTSIIYGWN